MVPVLVTYTAEIKLVTWGVGVITKVMYNQSINSTSINTCVMQSTIETRVVKVGDFVIIKEEYILYKGNPFEHVFIFLSINVSST